MYCFSDHRSLWGRLKLEPANVRGFAVAAGSYDEPSYGSTNIPLLQAPCSKSCRRLITNIGPAWSVTSFKDCFGTSKPSLDKLFGPPAETGNKTGPAGGAAPTKGAPTASTGAVPTTSTEDAETASKRDVRAKGAVPFKDTQVDGSPPVAAPTTAAGSKPKQLKDRE